MVRRIRAWADLQESREELSRAVRTHGDESEAAQLARARYREAAECYRMTLISEFEAEVLDHMSRDQ